MNQDQLQELTNLRHHLHRHPELSGLEVQTQATIRHFMSNCKPDHLWEVGKTGLLACFHGKEDGPNLLFRADMDALPIAEPADFLPYASIYPKVSHKCGHDGHSSILCGLAQQLSKKRPQKGKAYLLFQPAEETGQGAKSVASDEIFRSLKLDYAFALHNLPGYPKHGIVVREGAFSAAVVSLSASFQGTPAHAAEPEHGKNPALAIAKAIMQFDEWVQPDWTKGDFQLFTPIQVLMGQEAYGTSADHGILRYTIRTWSNAQMQALKARIEALLQNLAHSYGLQLNWEWVEEFYSNHNHPKAVALVKNSAQKAGFSVIERPHPFKWGEDFGLFTQQIPGVMFGLGIGEDAPDLHTTAYDFCDETIPTAVAIMEGVIDELLG